jgi:hypothetical protein
VVISDSDCGFDRGLVEREAWSCVAQATSVAAKKQIAYSPDRWER